MQIGAGGRGCLGDEPPRARAACEGGGMRWLQGITPMIDRESGTTASWSQRYGERHRLQRITEFPRGVAAPEKVRLYWRHDHYVLQWWDPGAKTNLSDRVDDDLVAAIIRARQIEERLVHFRHSGQGKRRRLAHGELVEAFVADLRQRADASEISPATVDRYNDALQHYRAF